MMIPQRMTPLTFLPGPLFFETCWNHQTVPCLSPIQESSTHMELMSIALPQVCMWNSQCNWLTQSIRRKLQKRWDISDWCWKLLGPKSTNLLPTSCRAATAQAEAYLQQVQSSPQENPLGVFNNLCSLLGEAKENLDFNEFSKGFPETFVKENGVCVWM